MTDATGENVGNDVGNAVAGIVAFVGAPVGVPVGTRVLSSTASLGLREGTMDSTYSKEGERLGIVELSCPCAVCRQQHKAKYPIRYNDLDILFV